MNYSKIKGYLLEALNVDNVKIKLQKIFKKKLSGYLIKN
jgi:hypothetical protein